MHLLIYLSYNSELSSNVPWNWIPYSFQVIKKEVKVLKAIKWEIKFKRKRYISSVFSWIPLLRLQCAAYVWWYACHIIPMSMFDVYVYFLSIKITIIKHQHPWWQTTIYNGENIYVFLFDVNKHQHSLALILGFRSRGPASINGNTHKNMMMMKQICGNEWTMGKKEVRVTHLGKYKLQIKYDSNENAHFTCIHLLA